MEAPPAASPVELEEAHERPRGGSVDKERQNRDARRKEDDLVPHLLVDLVHACKAGCKQGRLIIFSEVLLSARCAPLVFLSFNFEPRRVSRGRGQGRLRNALAALLLLFSWVDNLSRSRWKRGVLVRGIRVRVA